MTVELAFVGYCGQVWNTCYQALTYLNGLLANGATQAASVASPANLVLQTLRNGVTAIEAWQNGAALSIESQNLLAVQALPITLDPATTAYFSARIEAVSAAALEISALPPPANPFAVTSAIRAGNPCIAYPGYLEWCQGFAVETAPIGLTGPTLPSFAVAAAQAWLAVTNAVGVLQGSNPTSDYDTAARQYRCSATTAVLLSQLQSGPIAPGSFVTVEEPLTDNFGNILRDNFGNILYGGFTVENAAPLWNQIVALPTILLDGAALSTSPASLQAQQAMVIRNTLLTTAGAIALFLFSLRTSVGNAPVTAVLSNNDTLLDLAARQTGNFENWTAIAAINGLTPPYPGPTNQAVALSGRQLYMPGSGVTVGASATPPSYPDAAMGTDYYLGPINGTQPPWSGDIPLIKGLLNFAQALGRRIQTPIGALTYHQEYGSRIPAEVGAVQSADESSRLAAFGVAAIKADKRTGRILFAEASTRPGFTATFNATVQPVGPSNTAVQIQQHITPPGAR